MAKYTRKDPRNKKEGNHKQKTLEKDLKIREINHAPKQQMVLREVTFEDNNYDEDPEYLTG